LRGTSVQLIFSRSLKIISRAMEQDAGCLDGLISEVVELKAPIITRKTDSQGTYTEVVVPEYFPGGSIILLKTTIDKSVTKDIDTLVKTIPDSVFEGV